MFNRKVLPHNDYVLGNLKISALYSFDYLYQPTTTILSVNSLYASSGVVSQLLTPSIIELSDAPASTLTSYGLVVGQTAQGNISSSSDHDWYKVNLIAGKTYTIAEIGTGQSNLVDTYLNLRNSSGNIVAHNDDSGPGASSLITYTPTVSGQYYIDAASYSGVGQYGLSIALGSRAQFDIAMGAGSLDVDNLSWSSSGSPILITYGFRLSAPSYSNSSNLSTFTQLTTAEIVAVRTVLGLWSDVCGVTFQEVNPGGYTNNATILIGNYYDPYDGAGAFAYQPATSNTSYSSSEGDLWLNLAGGVNSSSVPIGSWTFDTIIHELGHALGLSHPGDYNAAPGVSITYANSAQFAQDSEQYTVMSYFSGSDTGGTGGPVDTPLLFDIAAMQKMYGANMTTRIGNSIYGFGSNVGDIYNFNINTSPIFCIWDAGGVDAINASNFSQNQVLNLNEGCFSNIGGQTSNISIALGAVIENAIGGTGNDTIIGNSANNILSGGIGNDSITGGLGNDTIDGGLGTDYVCYSNVRSAYTISYASGTYTVTGEGVDTVTGIEYFQFFDQTVSASVFGDIAAPLISTCNPVDGATNVAVDINIALTFNESIQRGVGLILIRSGSAIGPILEQFDIATSARLNISGGTLTIDPTSNLSNSTNYYVTIAAGVIKDLTGNSFTGLTSYDFTTSPPADTVAPSLVSVSPANAAINIDVNSNIVCIFNEAIQKGLGTIYIRRDSITGSIVEQFDVNTSAQLTVIDNALTIDPISTLNHGVNYYVSFSSGAIKDLAGNNFTGISDYQFTTAISYFNGTAGNDVIDGGSGNDVIDGGAGCDQIDGGAGADVMTGGAQGDIYIVDNLGDQVIETANNDASLTRNVSIFDQTISARLEKFYIAYYGRPADYDGLAYWQTTLANVLHGQEIQMCGYFGNPLQTEFLNLFGSGNTNDSFLTNVYLNLFNRAPDTEGMNYWKGVIADQQAHGKSLDDARATVVIWVLDGAQADDAQVINNKVNNAIGLSKVIAAYDDTNAYGDPSSSDIFAVARDWLKTTGAHDYSGLSADALQSVAQDILGNTIGDWVGSSVSFTLGNYVENLILTGVDPISGTGNALNNLMIGNAASNVLTGGAGSDIFMFQNALGINNIDTITDFTHGTDAIFLDQAIFTALTQGVLTANAFYVGSAAHDADDRIIYNASTGALYYDVDGVGGGAAVQIALIGAVSHPALSNADIFVV